MQSMRVFFAFLLAIVAHLALASKLRAAPAPAPAAAPGCAPGPAVATTTPDPMDVVEDAHSATAKALVDHVLDKSKAKMKEADIAHAKAGVHVAHAEGDKDAKKEWKAKVEDHKADLKKLNAEAEKSKAAYKASKASYKGAEK